MSRATIVIRAAARHDLVTHYRWLAGEAGEDIAERFLHAADQAFATLAENPNLGPNIGSIHPRLAALRKWAVKGFPNVLIFYEPRPAGVSIVRLIHASQDWWTLFTAADR